MFEFINHYSAIFIIPIVIIALTALVPIRNWQKRIAIYISVIVIGLIVLFNFQPGDSSVATESQAQEIIIVVGPDGEEVWRQSGGFLNKQAALEALDFGT